MIESSVEPLSADSAIPAAATTAIGIKRRQSDELLDELKRCQTDLCEHEAGYRQRLYALIQTGYGVACRLENDRYACKRFLGDPYWEGRPPEIEKPTDFFRAICRYLLKAKGEEAGKLASKYAKVMFHLQHGKIAPEDAAGVIKERGGIEKFSREGFTAKVYVHPEDVGDGMTATGDRIIYADEEEAKQKRRGGISLQNPEFLQAALKDLDARYQVQFTGLAQSYDSGIDLQVVAVRGNTQLPGSDLVTVPVAMESLRVARMERSFKRKGFCTLVVKLARSRTGSPYFRAIGVRGGNLVD